MASNTLFLKKKLQLYLLIIVLLLPTVGIVGIQLTILVAKIQAHELLEKNSFTTLILSPESILWKSGKEVQIAGKLFDVKSSFLNADGNYVLTGLFDEQETRLISELNTLKHKDAKRQGVMLQKFFSFQFNINTQNAGACNLAKYNQQQFGNTSSAKLKKGYILIFSPPPQS